MKFLFLLCLFVATTLAGKSKWKVPGCHLRGYQKQIHVDNCKSVIIGINACRGYCPSITYPSDYATKMESNGRHNYTAQAACCTIESYERIEFPMTCGGSTVMESIMSAVECRCGECEEY